MEARPFTDRLKRIETSTLQDRVYGLLRDSILKGKFHPGEQLTIASVAETLGTSKMPVREAFQRLVTQQALVQEQNRSFRIADLNRREYEEVLLIRCAVEGLATRLACANATESFLSELKRINTDMDESIDDNDHEASSAHNQSFHFAIYERADSPNLMKIIESQWLRIGPILGAAPVRAGGTIELFRIGCDQHWNIIRAIESGDEDAAAEELAGDLKKAAEWYRQHIEFEAD